MIVPSHAQRAVQRPEDVRNYVFSGGGARGYAFIGAVSALEKLMAKNGSRGRAGAADLTGSQGSLLESLKSRKGSGRYAEGGGGFAGASAGALVALMCALGYPSTEMKQRISEAFSFDGSLRVSEDIPRGSRLRVPDVAADAKYTPHLPTQRNLIGPNWNRHTERSAISNILLRRVIDGKGLVAFEDRAVKPLLDQLTRDLGIAMSIADRTPSSGVEPSFLQQIQNAIEALGVPSQRFTSEAADALYSRVRSSLAGDSDFEFLVDSRSQFNAYFYGLLRHGGLLSGLNMRFQVLRTAYNSPVARSKKPPHDMHAMTFMQLRELTGVELVVTGTNLRTSASEYFSVRDTPNFPIVDAVALSMTYPLLFKPVVISQSGVDGMQLPQRYRGEWVDGGMVNNFPLHAFDRSPDSPLDHRTLGFGLEDQVEESVAVTVDEMLIRNFKRLLRTLLAQAEVAQIRTELEEAQTLFLSAKGLDTLDLAPSSKSVATAIRAGESETTDYFSFGRTALPIVRAWHERGLTRPISDRTFEAIARHQLRQAYAFVSPGPMTIHPLNDDGTPNLDGAASFDIIATFDGPEVSDPDRKYVIYEAKSSASAPLTRKQAPAIEQIARNGGVISTGSTEDDDPDYVAYPSGAGVSAQRVRVVRPEQRKQGGSVGDSLYNEFGLAALLRVSNVVGLGREPSLPPQPTD